MGSVTRTALERSVVLVGKCATQLAQIDIAIENLKSSERRLSYEQWARLSAAELALHNLKQGICDFEGTVGSEAVRCELGEEVEGFITKHLVPIGESIINGARNGK